MLKQTLIALGILLIFGCSEPTDEYDYSGSEGNSGGQTPTVQYGDPDGLVIIVEDEGIDVVKVESTEPTPPRPVNSDPIETST